MRYSPPVTVFGRGDRGCLEGLPVCHIDCLHWLGLFRRKRLRCYVASGPLYYHLSEPLLSRVNIVSLLAFLSNRNVVAPVIMGRKNVSSFCPTIASEFEVVCLHDIN